MCVCMCMCMGVCTRAHLRIHVHAHVHIWVGGNYRSCSTFCTRISYRRKYVGWFPDSTISLISSIISLISPIIRWNSEISRYLNLTKLLRYSAYPATHPHAYIHACMHACMQTFWRLDILTPVMFEKCTLLPTPTTPPTPATILIVFYLTLLNKCCTLYYLQ